MSEATPKSHGDSAEISGLLAELELQIESLNAGLSKMRGTVARISYAALNSSTPMLPASWEATHAAANGGAEPAAPTEASPAIALASPSMPTFSAGPAAPEAQPEPGFWDSVAEGASWPRSRTHEAPGGPEAAGAAEAEPEAGRHGFDADHGSPAPATFQAEDSAEAVKATSLDDAWRTDQLSQVTQDSVAQAPQETAAALEGREAASPDSGDWAIKVPEEQPETTATEQPSEAVPSTLSFGWPDESIWSQNFEWPAMSRKDAAAESTHNAEDDPARAGVSDIVAQVRAELEAARGEAEDSETRLEAEVAAPDSSIEHDEGQERRADPTQRDEVSRRAEPVWWEMGAVGQNADMPNPDIAAGVPDPAKASGESGAQVAASVSDNRSHDGLAQPDDTTRRDDVSRAVEAIRRQIEAGDLEAAMREQGIAERPGGGPAEAAASADATAPGTNTAWPGATRDEGTNQDGKPAFRLAAPASPHDWSHVQMEASGPPVVVMKDADGRVELASVYETLNELGCGDGAALLNYTPHSVTVGLPTMAQFPSPEQMAEAVERVFGLTSRVESDGVRITVSIGAEPKQRSVGAA